MDPVSGCATAFAGGWLAPAIPKPTAPGGAPPGKLPGWGLGGRIYFHTWPEQLAQAMLRPASLILMRFFFQSSLVMTPLSNGSPVLI